MSDSRNGTSPHAAAFVQPDVEYSH
jgi:hypothetical protein